MSVPKTKKSGKQAMTKQQSSSSSESEMSSCETTTSSTEKPDSRTKPPSSAYRTLAIRKETHAGLKSLSMDLSLPMAATVALVLKGWESVPDDVRRDLLGLPPLLTGPDGNKLSSWLSKAISE